MGHFASEIDPDWGKRIDRTDRIVKLKKKLAPLPLSEFAAGELGSLYRVMGVGHDLLDDPNDDDLTLLEKHFRKPSKKR